MQTLGESRDAEFYLIQVGLSIIANSKHKFEEIDIIS